MKKQEEQIKMVLVAYITKEGKRQYIKRYSKTNIRSLAYTELPEEACELEKSDIPILVEQLRKTSTKPFMLKPMYLERIVNRNLKQHESDATKADSKEDKEDIDDSEEHEGGEDDE